jgi:hypothetical protein
VAAKGLLNFLYSNWAVPAANPEPLCRSCRFTRVIPDLTQPGHRDAWYRLEVAKRRLLYSLLRLGLPLANKVEDPVHGLAYEFRSDPDVLGTAPVLTGHCNGVITINVAEADDAEREKRRRQMHEPYRTLLGHFSHESGHYYWDWLPQASDRLDAFRDLFGDEREDYSEALTRHYQQGGPYGLAEAVRQRLCECASLGGLGRNLGALSAYDRYLGNRRGLRSFRSTSPCVMAAMIRSTP